MAGKNAVSSIHKINFCFDVPNVSALNYDGISSSTVQVVDAPWHVAVRKISDRGDDELAIFLVYDADSDLQNRSYTVHGRFKLLSFNSEQDTLEYIFPPFIYDVEKRNIGTALIEWSDLFDATKQYIKNDTIRLDITLEMANPNDVNKSELKLENIDEGRNNSTFRLTVHNIEKLLAVRSPFIVLRNIRWFFTVFKHLDHLGICLDSSGISDKFPCEVKMIVKLVSSKSSIDSIEQMKTKKMKKGEVAEILELISWNQLANPQNGFINHNSISLEIKLTAITAEDVAPNSRNRTLAGPSNEAIHRKMECTICMEEFEEQEVSMTNCGHLFCSDCIRDEIKRNKECPTCRTSATLDQLKRAYLPF